MKKNIFVLIMLIFSAITGCEETSTAIEYRKEVVVNGTLTANQNIDTLRLHWTGQVDKFYDLDALAISNATVVVRGVDVNFYDSLIYDASNPGRYYSTDGNKKIIPTKTYKLEVSVPGWAKQVTATTTVPDTFRITSATLNNGDTVKYNLFAPVHEFYWSSSNNYATYLPTITYLDSNAAMIPKAFYSDTTSKDFRKPEIIGYRIGLPKEQQNSDLPWVFLSYYGNIQFDVYAVDFNFSDYINQIIPAQGGELKEIRFNVQGGIGIFSARTKASGGFKIYLKP